MGSEYDEVFWFGFCLQVGSDVGPVFVGHDGAGLPGVQEPFDKGEKQDGDEPPSTKNLNDSRRLGLFRRFVGIEDFGVQGCFFLVEHPCFGRGKRMGKSVRIQLGRWGFMRWEKGHIRRQ